MKNWSIGYETLRTYVRFAFWLTHKKIVVTGLDHLPKGKPIIFAANHQNALMDPLALACTNPLQTLWLARADIFKNKAVRPFLKFMKMVPIYRIRDGKDNLSNNEEVFNQVIQVLEDKQSVALFPEAAHSGKRQMLPHRKAIPRIASEAEEKNKFNLGLQIIPVGIYYDHYWKFNRTLIVQYGEAIEIDGYRDCYAENPQNMMLALRDEIHDRLLPLTMQINSEKYYHDYEDIRMVAGEAYATKRFLSKDSALQLFYADQELISKIERLEADHPAVFEEIKKRTNNYFSELTSTGFTDDQITKATKTSFPKLLVQIFESLLSLPLFAFGFLFNFIPYFLPRLTLTRKVKDPAFLSTFIFVAGLILFPVFYLIESLIIWSVTDLPSLAMGTFILMPFAGKIAYNLLLFYQDLIRVIQLRIGKKRRFKRWKGLRLEIIKIIEINIPEFRDGACYQEGAWNTDCFPLRASRYQ